MEKLKQIIEGIEQWKTNGVYRSCLSFMDLTSLNTTDTDEKIISMIGKVNTK